jgi:hypothetical protein
MNPDYFWNDLRFSRRMVLKCGLFATASYLLSSRLGLSAPASPTAKARSVIQIWLWGGSSHIDTFDPKPAAGYDYCGPLSKPIATNVDGMQICELLPELAKQGDKYSIIRSMTHGVNGHETASYMVQTGHPSSENGGSNVVYPSLGAVVSLFKGYEAGYTGLIPPYIVLTEGQGRFSEAGFLGSRYKPFITGGDPNRPRFAVEGIVAENISDERQKQRRELLHKLDSLHQAMPDNEHFKELANAEAAAYDLILGDSGKIFDLNQEDNALRDRYGRNSFGQSCLMARRLVEKGVRFVTINYKGWDTHKQHFPTMNRKLPELDKGLATLLQDLNDRGLLSSTVVWMSGEFGRTPKVQWESPWNGGRGHHGEVFSALIAGGGFKGGHVIGASDEKAMQVAARPVYPQDVIGSIYQQLGIDTASKLRHPQGFEARVLPTPEEGAKSGGYLTEIM